MVDPDRLSQQPISQQVLAQQRISQEPLPQQPATIEDMVQAASSSVEAGTDIRARVRDLTLHALRDRRFEPEAIRDVLRAMTEGIRRGAEQRPHGVRQALSDALTGLDDAMMKTAEAASLALRELTAKGKDVSEHELKQVLGNMKRMEEDFLSTLRQAADGAGVQVKQEMLDLLSHARQTGTDMGAKVAQTLTEFASRMTTISLEGAKLGFEAARDFSARFALVASGILAGLADALHKQAADKNKK
jgi:hypothetical protein